MKKAFSITLCVIISLFCALRLSGQERRSGWEDRMKAEKIAFLTDAMDLTSSEAEKFWPVYNKMEAEKRASWGEAMKAVRSLDEGIKANKDDKEISVLLERFMNSQKADNDIDARYLKEFRKILSNEKIAKMYLAEENFRRMQIHRLNRNDNGKNDKK